jgi:hypothetical protein
VTVAGYSNQDRGAERLPTSGGHRRRGHDAPDVTGTTGTTGATGATAVGVLAAVEPLSEDEALLEPDDVEFELLVTAVGAAAGRM